MRQSYSQVIHRGVADDACRPLILNKILILSARLGRREDVAAQNLRQALDRLAPPGTRIESADLFASSHGRFDALFGPAFHSAGRARSLADMLRSREPDVVVATSPFYGAFLAEMARSGRTRDFTLIALVTEPEIDGRLWARMGADFFVVAGEAAARDLVSAGVLKNKVRLFGFPVQRARADAGTDSPPDLAEDRARILYLVNNARKKAPALLERLLRHPEWTVTACIDDAELEAKARMLAATARGRLRVIGHFRGVPQLLRTHHLVISRAETAMVHEAIAARCPLIALKIGARSEEMNTQLLQKTNAGARAEKPREVVDWIERALRDEGRLLQLWRRNLEPLGSNGGANTLAQFVLEQVPASAAAGQPEWRALPAPSSNGRAAPLALLPPPRVRRGPKKLLLCDLHTHTTWSDGKLSIAELVDFYGQRGFDCLSITDHLCDPKRLLGKLVNLTGLVIPPGEVAAYFDAIEREKKRAWAQYDLLLMTGIEFNKDGYTAKTSTHLLGIDLKQPIDPSLDLKELIAEIHAQGALAIASHPHEIKSEWGKNTLYLWEHLDEYAPLLDAWEVANRDDIFNPIGLKKLPFIASSDFHKPKHIHSWKTVLHCEKHAEAIKQCIRVNRDVSLTLYRDHRFGLEEERAGALEIESAKPAAIAKQG